MCKSVHKLGSFTTVLAATKKAEKKPQVLKIEFADHGRYNIMRKSVHKLGSFTTVLVAKVEARKKPQALKIDLFIKEGLACFAL